MRGKRAKALRTLDCPKPGRKYKGKDKELHYWIGKLRSLGLTDEQIMEKMLEKDSENS